eukprot:GDKJ01033957.1.p1 GENE.GDKJ01033957.1~~GDKJ01033957.1.p1  ORF type:complete len:317 (+),score=32.05 GDKJ01033957.1:44-994(+)
MVLIVLCGPPQSGKMTAANLLRDSLLNCTVLPPVDESDCCGSAQQLVDIATNRWRENFVLPSITCKHAFDILHNRPLAVFVWIDAPMLLRYERFSRNNNGSFNDFLALHDHVAACGLGSKSVPNGFPLIVQNDGNPDNMLEKLMSLNLESPGLVRPSWDEYFLCLARLTSSRTNCMKRRVGAVLVKDNRIVSTGYNGTPSSLENCSEGGCPRCNDPSAHSQGHGLDSCLCVHAEANALLEAGIQRSTGSTLYLTHQPCLGCAKLIVQSRVAKVIFLESYFSDGKSEKLLQSANIVCIKAEKESIGSLSFINRMTLF